MIMMVHGCLSSSGGLNEVSYTHSNQRVVGSSRAENYISKAAVRDVFERQRHSQVPAHMLLDSQQVKGSLKTL